MFGFEIDKEAARSSLAFLITSTQRELDLQLGTTPDFPSAAAGRDFEAHGAALADMFAALHMTMAERIQNVLAVAESANEEVNRFDAADTDFGDHFAGATGGGV